MKMPAYRHPLGVKSPVEVPRYMRGRPIWNGFYVPYFVTWYKDRRQVHESVAGAEPSFPTIDKTREALCRRRRYCWICGRQMGTFKCFVMGPLAALQRISSEPPSHRECAVYAVQVCPFMIGGYDMVDAPDTINDDQQVFEEMSTKNEQLNVIWVCHDYTLQPADPSRGLFIYQMGQPSDVLLYHRGRPATLAQAVERVTNAINDNERIRAVIPSDELRRRVDHLLRYTRG